MCRLVAEGKLSSDDAEPLLRYTTEEPLAVDMYPKLMAEAVNLLVSLANGDGQMFAPSPAAYAGMVHDRAAATHKAAFDQLCKHGLLERGNGQIYVLTLRGFDAADACIALINANAK